MNNVTGIIVSYNTPDLLKKCYDSIRKFYPSMKLIIIDGSPIGSDCYNYASSLSGTSTAVVVVTDLSGKANRIFHAGDVVTERNFPIGNFKKLISGGYIKIKVTESDINIIVTPGYNIGHGNGMKMGISLCKTEYFLLIDSDVTIDKPGVIEEMMSCMEENYYGIGQIMQVNDKGMNVGEGIYYLHPHFALISKRAYEKFSPFINHGAPCISAMLDLNENMKYVIDSFPVHKYITHAERGTRKQRPSTFHSKHWDKI